MRCSSKVYPCRRRWLRLRRTHRPPISLNRCLLSCCASCSGGGIAEGLSSAGYCPFVADAGNATDQQIAFVETLLGQRVDGLVLATVSREDVVGYCIERRLPSCWSTARKSGTERRPWCPMIGWE